MRCVPAAETDGGQRMFSCLVNGVYGNDPGIDDV